MRKIWPFTFNFMFYASGAFVLPFIVLYYQRLGFTGAQIGLLTGITPLITFFSAPLWTGLADTTRRHHLIMSLACLAGMITLFVFPLLKVFASILLIAILLNFFVGPVTSFVDSASMFMLADEKDMYGRIRLGGTIGWGLAAPMAGMLVQNLGLKLAFWGSAGLFLLCFFISQKLVYGTSSVDEQTRGRVRTLLISPRWFLFLTVAFTGGVALAASNSYFFPYMKELGADESTMGLALTVGTLSEVPVLFFGNHLIKRFKSQGLFMLAMIITGLRMVLFGVSGTPTFTMFFQLLNGLSFPAMWVAGVSYAHENAPEGMNTTAQGLFGAMVMGFGLAVGGFVGGPLLENIGGRGLFLVYGIFVLTIVVSVLLIQRHLFSENP